MDSITYLYKAPNWDMDSLIQIVDKMLQKKM